MKVSTQLATLRVTRRFTITENHPIVGMAYATQPKKVRVESGQIEYSYKDGRWVIDNEYAINLNAIVLKKDGTDSLNKHSRHPNTVSYRDVTFTPDFAWLQPVVDILRPRGDLSMITLTEHEL